MPATMNVNDKTVVHQGSSGIATAFPDVCKTPSPAGPIPIPYPNIAKSSDTASGSKNTTVDGNPIMLKGSNYATSMGDEAGSAGGGVISSKIKGKAEFVMYSFDVKVEGANVCRLGDLMTQNMSSLNIGGFPNFQPLIVLLAKVLDIKVLQGRVQEIRFESGIDVNRDQDREAVAPGSQPHWQNEKGSRIEPAVYLRSSAGGQKKLKVKIKITALENISGSATLSGEGDGVKVKPVSFSLKKGEIGPLDLEFETIPDEVVHLRPAIQWTVKACGVDYAIGATTVDLYFLFAKPVIPWTSTPVWHSVLRFLFDRAGVRGTDEPEAIGQIVRYIHAPHGHIYDVRNGASGYVTNGGFRISDYIAAPHVVNCHDQAYATITLAAALGIKVTYVYMQPFGFIDSPSLVGFGPCNNPFFRNPANLPDRVIMPPRSAPSGWVGTNWVPGKSSFGNHGFCYFNRKIYDACAGPAMGTEDPNEYANSSIDRSLILEVEEDYDVGWVVVEDVRANGRPITRPSSRDMRFYAGAVRNVS